MTIGIELVAEPTILFLDEPTTGLDSAAAYAVMSAIHTLSRHMSVICTVHQPSMELTRMFDDILIMKDGGEVVYMGEMGKLVTYFAENHMGECPPAKNPVDFALEQLKKCNETSQKGQKHRQEDEEQRKAEKEKGGGLLRQLSKRLSSRHNASPQGNTKADGAQGERGAPTRGKSGRKAQQSSRAELDETLKEDGEEHKESNTPSDEDGDVEMQRTSTRDQQKGGKSSSNDGDERRQGGAPSDGSEQGVPKEDLSPERAGRLRESFLESPYYEGVKKTLDEGVMPEEEKTAYKPPDLNSSHANFFTQVVWLSQRFRRNVYRNKFGLVIRFLLIIVFVFFVGTIFLRLGYNQEWANQRLGVLFLVLINVMFSTNAVSRTTQHTPAPLIHSTSTHPTHSLPVTHSCAVWLLCCVVCHCVGRRMLSPPVPARDLLQSSHLLP